MQADVPAAAVVRVVAGEAVEPGVDRDLKNVARPARIDLQARSVRPNTDDPAAAELDLLAVGAFGLNEAEVADGEVEPAVDAQAHAVRGVVCGPILEGEGDVLDQDLLLIGPAIPVAVDEGAQVWGMHQ